jgi:hypothetical protein
MEEYGIRRPVINAGEDEITLEVSLIALIRAILK